MKIGIFDSGLGGLITMRGIVGRLPEYDYVYLGDTKRVPYGNRSQQTIYEFTEAAVRFLFERDCGLVIIACNTASTEALRRIQQEFLPKFLADRRVLGIIIPTVETAIERGSRRLGVIGTPATVRSGVYPRELRKLRPDIEVLQVATPLLAPMIENGGAKWLEPILADYLKPLLEKNIDTLVLGCTHYPIAKEMIRSIAGPGIQVICQDELAPGKLEAYIRRHPEIEARLSKKGDKTFFATDITETLRSLAASWFGRNADLRQAELHLAVAAPGTKGTGETFA
ncbi:glutamate racemase [Candidatus Uhrbacteria bacterium]|nr:glutamate racemase [Candidatus Uhrbacteria bacterium]